MVHLVSAAAGDKKCGQNNANIPHPFIVYRGMRSVRGPFHQCSMKKAIVIAVTFLSAALASVRTLRSLVTHATGSVFDSNARLEAPMPPYVSTLITEASRTHGVDPRLVAAIARRESAFNPNAVSRVGAGGIMQLMPATARYLGVSNVFDARQNVFAGTRYLRTLLDAFNGDLDLAVAAYNAGPGAVKKYNG